MITIEKENNQAAPKAPFERKSQNLSLLTEATV